ncbi:MAG: Gfo/Idh/MocA family oxidoreductase [Thermoguttaceae bacterium]
MAERNRRDFLKCSAIGGVAAMAFAGGRVWGRALGANDRIRVAVVGINSQGLKHLEDGYMAMKDVEVAYLVDPDRRLFDSRRKLVKDRTGFTPRCITDLREALDDKSLDVVSIATPNHWHSLQAIWCCQAGKDVYVEKPCSHNVFEGRKLVEAARKYDRIVQHGTQNRADRDWQKLSAAVRSGKYGKLLISYGYASKPRASIGFRDPETSPAELDYDLWTGPAPMQPYRTNLVPYNWHWVWNFGNGEIGNQGVHQLDVARWVLPDDAAPKQVLSLGGRFGYKDQGQTPNTQLTIFDFGDVKLFFEDRGLVDKKTMKVANEFYTDQGVLRDGKFFPKGKGEGVPLDLGQRGFCPRPPHFQNFIQCVRSRKREDLFAEIVEGHRSALLAHLGNISYRLGQDVPFSKETRAFGDDRAAYEAFESMKQHLVDAAKLDLASATYRLGRRLTFDAQSERFVGDDEASRMLTREYRKPFVVPNVV